jgi:plastocyanin
MRRQKEAQTMTGVGLTLTTLGLLTLARPALAQRVHQIRLLHESAESYAFDPRRVEARAGDVLEFVVVSGGPYLVGFEAQGLKQPDADALEAGFSGRSGRLRGPVLGGAGARFRVVLPGLPKGSYRFVSFTQVAYRMAGLLVIK